MSKRKSWRLLAALECLIRGHDWWHSPTGSAVCWRCTTPYRK